MEHLYSNLDINQIYITDGMADWADWVRIVDRDNNVLYANKKMCDDFGRNLNGEKCYNIINKDKKCGDCIACKTIQSGQAQEEEVSIGDKYFNVVSFPIKNDDVNMVAAVEIFRDISYAKKISAELNETNKRMLEDVSFAKNMQIRMLPPKEVYSGLLLDYLYEPSEILSGDFFDVFKIDNSRTGIYICDVVGHGVSASLLTMFVRQSLRTLCRGNGSININNVMKELHKMFLSLNLDADKYFSLLFGIYDMDTRQFYYINAGHNTNPILISKNKLSFLKAKGYPICNLFDNVEYDVSIVNLDINDKIYFYTDGIVEAKNNNLEEFGENRLINILTAEDSSLNKLYTEVKKFSTDKLKDDCAIMKIQVID